MNAAKDDFGPAVEECVDGGEALEDTDGRGQTVTPEARRMLSVWWRSGEDGLGCGDGELASLMLAQATSIV